MSSNQPRPRNSGAPRSNGSGKPAGSGGRGGSSGKPSFGGKSSGGQSGSRGGSSAPRRGEGQGQQGGSSSTGRQDRPQRSSYGKPSSGDGSKKPFGSGNGRSGGRPGAPSADRRPYKPREQRPEPEPRTEDQKRYDGPDLPDFITGKEIDHTIITQLKGLPDKLIIRVARLLAAADHYIDDDPELAYQYAKAAKSRTQRLAVIREALGEAAYAAGHYAEALAELRAAKRMNGATAYLPIMADCHRALGQPEQAIKLAHSPSVVNFIPEAKAEMTIVESGARRDMGQFDAALRVLELSPINNKSRASWVVRLRYAYADTLAAAGRLPEALEWFHRTYAFDADETTDAAQRAEELEKLVVRD